MKRIRSQLIGSLAISKAGHDKDETFVIISEDNDYVYLVDGRNRTLDKPKRKKRKHIQPIYHVESQIIRKLDNDEKIINEDIKRTIKLWEQQSQNSGGNENV